MAALNTYDGLENAIAFAGDTALSGRQKSAIKMLRDAKAHWLRDPAVTKTIDALISVVDAQQYDEISQQHMMEFFDRALSAIAPAVAMRRNPHGEGPYTHFVVQPSTGLTISGWWGGSDARDDVREWRDNGISDLKVVTRSVAKSHGYSVDNRRFSAPGR